MTSVVLMTAATVPFILHSYPSYLYTRRSFSAISAAGIVMQDQSIWYNNGYE